MSKIFRISIKSLAAITGFVILLLVFINLPFSRNFVTGRVNALFQKLELPLHIRTIKTVRLKKVHVEGVSIIDPGGDTLIYARSVETRIKLLALAQSKVLLDETELSGAVVKLVMNYNTRNYTLAEAFNKASKEKTDNKEEKGSNWEFRIRKGQIHAVHFFMEDTLSGIRIHQDIKDISLRRFKLGLLEQEIRARTLELNDARGSMRISSVQVDDSESIIKRSSPWTYMLQNLALKDVDFTFEQTTDSLWVSLELDQGVVGTNKMDLTGKILDLDEITIKGARGKIYSGKRAGQLDDSGQNKTNGFPWNIKTNKVNLTSVDLTSGTYAGQSGQSESNEIGMKDLEMKLRDFQISREHAGMKLMELGFALSNGFTLEHMEADLNSDSESTRLKMELETNGSKLNMEGGTRLGFFDLLSDPTGVSDGELKIHDALLSFSDIAYFTPLQDQIPLYSMVASTPTGLDLQLEINEHHVTLSEFSLFQKQKFNLSITGSADHPFDPPNSSGGLDLELSGINTPWLIELLSGSGMDTPLPDSTELSLKAGITGPFSNPEYNLQLTSDLGRINLTGQIDFRNKSYALNTRFDQLLLGSLLEVPDLGPINGSARIDGSGFSTETIDSNIELLIDSAVYKGHTYTQTTIESVLKPGEYDIMLETGDSAFTSSVILNILQTESLFTANAKGNLFAQLDQLHFVSDTLAVKTDFSATMLKEPDAIESNISLHGIRLASSRESVKLQHINAVYISDTSRTTLTGEGDFFQAELQVEKSIHELNQFGQSYSNYLRSFLDSSQSNAQQRVSELPAIYATSNITNHEALNILFQDTGFQISSLNFSILNEPLNQKVKYQIEGSNIHYKNARLGELTIQVTDSAGILNMVAVADSSTLFSGPPSSFRVSGQIAHRSSYAELTILNALKDTIYEIDVASVIDSNQMVLTIPSQNLVLNHQSWELESPDFLIIELDSFKISPGFMMRTDSSLLQFTTERMEGEVDYKMHMDRVKLTSLLWDDLLTVKPEGYLSGNFDLNTNKLAEKRMTTDMIIRDATYSDLRLDNIRLEGFMAMRDSGIYAAKLDAKLDSAVIQAEGENIQGEDRSLTAEFSHVPLTIIQSFTLSYLSDMKGTVSGYFQESMRSDSEKFRGELAFHETNLKIVPLNTVFTIPDQVIKFENDQIVLDNFRVQDTLNKALLVDGFIDFRKKPIYADLDISSSKLQLMNTTEADNEKFFGNLFVDSKISFRGPVNNPDIKAKILLSKGTKLNFNSKDDIDFSESAELVNFTTYTEEGEPIRVSPIVGHRRFQMASVETIIEIDPTTQVHFSLAKKIFNIDLQIQGGGLLNYSMLKNDQVSLSGRYGISEGSAKLNIVGWPNKYFEISKGGYVNWDGNVEDPELKFEAVSKVSSSYTNPVDGRIRNVDFNVVLMLSEHLSDLNVLFTIDTEDQYLMSIINTLSPEEKMRQAITILLFEIVDLPGISTSSDYVSQQVSQILASQLNLLTKSAIKGVDISFGIDTYTQKVQGRGETTSTSLSYEVKKTLLNDRAKIELSGRLQNPNEIPGAPDESLNNVSFEYQLDSAQTKYLKVYNEQTYEDVFEGQVTKTGIGFTYRKPYRTFRDIWKRKKKRIEGNGENETEHNEK